MLSESTVVRLHSGGSMCFEGVIVFVLDRILLLGGPSTCSGVVWVTATSGYLFLGSCCLSSPCWSVFHPRSGMRPCGIRFLAVLPLL